MADYIDRDELLELLQAGYESEEAPCWSTCPWIEDEIKRVPSVDAVEVVRCKDCKHRQGAFCQYFYKRLFDVGRTIHAVTDDDYCKWGEKE